MFSLPGYPPDSVKELIMLPLLLTFFAVLIRVSAVQYQRTYGKTSSSTGTTIAIAILLLLACISGGRYLYALYNPDRIDRMVYYGVGLTGKMKFAHYVGFFVPLLAGIGIFFYDRTRAKKSVVN